MVSFSPDTDLAPDDPSDPTDPSVQVNQLGDQDAVNLAGPALPESTLLLTPANVRRYPWLFEQAVEDMQADDPMTDEQRAEHNQAVEDHWRSMGVEPADESSDY